METNKSINIAGMTCSSCERLITKAVESEGGKVHSISATSGKAVVDYQEGTLERIKTAIAASGYSVLDGAGKTVVVEPFEAEIKIFLKKLVDGEKELKTERKIVKMSMLSILALAAIGFFFYMTFWRGLPGIGARIPFLFYSGVSAVAITAPVAHYNSHRFQFTCMEGMMTGMTIGMIAGFLFGAVVGATNGMFIGSVFGMAVGMIAGAYCGKCCGIMGEGYFQYQGSLNKGAENAARSISLFFAVHDAELAFQPGWPALREGRGRVLIEDTGVRVDLAEGRILDSQVSDAQALIATALPGQPPRLLLTSELSSSVEDALHILQQTPIGTAETFAEIGRA